jgi:spore germination protein KA
MKFSNLFLPKGKKKKPARTTKGALSTEGVAAKAVAEPLSDNLSLLNNIFGQTIDFHAETVQIGRQEGVICYLDSMTSHKAMVEEIRQPLMLSARRERPVHSKTELMELRKELFAGCTYETHDSMPGVVTALLNGYVVLFADKIPTALALLVNDIEHRGINEPSTQTIVRGPKEGFTESLNTNVSLIRRRVKNPKLQFEEYTIGKDTQTKVVLAYMNGIINDRILQEVRHRLNRIKTSAVFDTGNIEEYIQDKTFTPFPTVYNTERPDTVSANLVEGKFVILVDGTPFALVAPTVMTDFFQSPEDYYQPYYMATFVRMVRYLSFMIALILPAFYLAVTTYHHELIPTQLLISLAAQREGVPLPAVVEVLAMEFTFEIIREAGIRMPRAVGQAVSIVGALVIGQAAVEAGIISNSLIIVVALTGLSSFASPVYALAMAIRILRFALILLASMFGLYGMVLGLIMMVAHLASLRSFGVPYLAPVAPFIIEDMDDVFVRFPIWGMKTRPKYLETKAPLKNPKSKTPTPPPKTKGGGGS